MEIENLRNLIKEHDALLDENKNLKTTPTLTVRGLPCSLFLQGLKALK
ncbi:MAG TPA: hypothetical protein PKM40_03025 [Bacteroidia bacterium]|nr:hypothetical protein [Bacteroidia bacterium]